MSANKVYAAGEEPEDETPAGSDTSEEDKPKKKTMHVHRSRERQ